MWSRRGRIGRRLVWGLAAAGEVTRLLPSEAEIFYVVSAVSGIDDEVWIVAHANSAESGTAIAAPPMGCPLVLAPAASRSSSARWLSPLES